LLLIKLIHRQEAIEGVAATVVKNYTNVRAETIEGVAATVVKNYTNVRAEHILNGMVI
jgi:hypothetical protein